MLMSNLILCVDQSTSERSFLSGLSPAQCICRRNALRAGGPLPSSPPPPLCLWVACGSGVRGFAVQGDGGRGSGIQSVKRHRIDRGQDVQAGWLAWSRWDGGALRAFPEAQWKKYYTAPCGI